MEQRIRDESEPAWGIDIKPGLNDRFDILSEKLSKIIQPVDTDEYSRLAFLVFTHAENFRRLYAELDKSGDAKDFRAKIYEVRLNAQFELETLEAEWPIERPAAETIWDLSEVEAYHYQDRPTPWARYVESLGHYLAIYPS